VNFVAGNSLTNGGSITVKEDVSFTAQGGYIINQGEVSGEKVAFNAESNIVNEAGITADKVVNLVAGNSLTNGGRITAKEDVSFSATTGKVTNSGAIEGSSVEFMAGTDIVNASDIVANESVLFTADSNVTSSGNISAAEDIILAAQKGFINATDLADYLVKKGMPFRTAYKISGTIVGDCIKNGKVLETLTLEEYKQYNELFEEDLYNEISLETCVGKRISEGSTGPASVEAQISAVDKFIADCKQ
jgi:hypothetical protein